MLSLSSLLDTVSYVISAYPIVYHVTAACFLLDSKVLGQYTVSYIPCKMEQHRA